MKSKLLTLSLFAIILFAIILFSGYVSRINQNIYQSQNYSFEFQYPENWYVKETNQTILISPDSDFDSENQMIGENAPIEIHISNKSVIDDIVQNYNSSPAKTIIAERQAQKISYEGLGQTFTVISINEEDKFVEIWKNQTNEISETTFELVLSTFKFN